MKKRTLLTTILLSIPIFVLSQTLNIHKNDGSVHNFDMSDIDSITFSENSSIAPIPCPGTPTVTYEGKTYNTVQIGDQCWLKENLDVGTMIDSLQDATNFGVIDKYCYRNDPFNCAIYGGLYQWEEAMQYVNTEGARGICPEGWHIPTFAELQTLKNTVGDHGNALKAIGQGTGDGAGTNTSGFSALISGRRETDGTFFLLGISTYFWSSTEFIPTFGSGVFAYIMNLNDEFDGVSFDESPRSDHGNSVRCLKD